MKKFFKNKPRAWFIIGAVSLFVLLIISAFVIDYQTRNPKYLATVGGVEITELDLNYEIYGRYLKGTPENPENVDEEQKDLILNDLIESEIARQEASKLGLSVSEEDVDQYLEANSQKVKNHKEEEVSISSFYSNEEMLAAKSSVEKKLYIEKVQNELLGWREGKYLLFRFDKYVDYGEDIGLEGVGNQGLIKEQKEHAQSVSSSVSSDLQAGNIDFTEATSTLTGDKKLNIQAFEPLRPNIMGTFSKEDFLEGSGMFDENFYQGLKESVTQTSKDSFSDPITLKANAKGEFVDFAFAVVAVTDEKNGSVYSYSAWLNEKIVSQDVKTQRAHSFFGDLWSSLKNLFSQEAEAGAETCSVAYTGTHKTNLKVHIKEKTSSGESYRANVPVTITAGSSSSANGLSKYSSSCGYSSSGYSINVTDDDGILYLNDNDYSTRNPALINCGVTSAASVKLPSLGKGHWELDYGYNNEWLKSFTTNSDGSALLELQLGTATNWANGTTVYKTVVWHPDPSTSYRFRPAVSYFVDGDETNEASAGDVVEVAMWVFNEGTTTIPDIYVRDNINNNGVDDTVGSGTIERPYSIREVTKGTTIDDINRVCAHPECSSELQGAGNYGTPTYNKLQWASHSESAWSGGVKGSDQYEVQFKFKVPSGYTGKYISTRIGAMALSTARDLDTATPQILSNLALLRIVNERTLAVNVSPSGGGAITGGLGGNDNGQVNCPGDCAEQFDYGITTQITAAANTGYEFQNWSGCSTSTSATISLAMTVNRSCTANFTAEPEEFASLSCSVSPQTGLAPLVIKVDTSHSGLSPERFDYNMGDGTTLSDRTDVVYYTYPDAAGSPYIITVDHDDYSGGPVQCANSPVEVRSPSDSEGGEVAP